METDLPKKELSPLSASKVKVLENCSWLYWCSYHLKLPQEKNEGAKKGDVCHSLFEVLLNKKHKPKVDLMVKSNTITVCPAVERLVRYYIKREGLSTSSPTFQHIDLMVLVGLKSDFYVQGGVLVAPEFRFDIVNDNFRIKGFMDKPFIVGDTILIDDFKSAKKKFEGEDEESNVQALMYSYAAKQLWPHLTPVVRFIFLQYPENPMMEVKFSNETLLGFEYYLKAMQERVNKFNINTAKSAFAADQEPHDGGFNGKLLCGFAKSPDQKKKDGTKMWHCPYRFPIDYYTVKDKNGKVLYSVFKAADLKPTKEGETVEKCHYEGCPKHRNVLNDFGSGSVQKKYTNVLDDF
jgi:hypothetical protein